MDKFYIVDAANLLFRSYYAIGFMTNQQGQSTNALFGFIRSILKLIKDFNPHYLVISFDGPDNKKERRALYEHYKSHRKGMPEDLYPQLEWALEFCEAYGIPILNVDGVEADDTMGSLAVFASQHGDEAYLCSSDKDLCQLVSDKIFVINLAKDNLLLDKDKVKEVFGVFPEQIVDYLALMGDASDNIPGLEGIGPKSACQLINEFGSVENLLKNSDKVSGKKGDVIRNGKETLLLSQKLAQINLHVPIVKDKAFYRLKEPNIERLKELYQRMHFLSLLKDLDSSSPTPKIHIQTAYHTVQDKAALDHLMHSFKEEKELVIDTETTSLNFLDAKLVGISLAKKEGEAFYIPFNGALEPELILSAMKSLLPKHQWIGHNIKYDKHVLANVDIDLKPLYFDTMLASYLLHPHNPRHNLDALALEHFDKVKIPIEELIGKGKKEISMEEVPIEKVAEYSCEDADYTLRLMHRFKTLLKENKVLDLFETIEMPLIDVLFRMERRGIYVDKAYLTKLSSEFEKEIAELQKEIYKEAKEEFNLNSPKQLSHILFEKMGISPPKKTATGFSTAVDVLESLQEEVPFVKKIIAFRALDKLRSTFIEAMIEQIHPKTGRIHCTFNQSVAATGRLSSQDPNLQNIPVRTPEGRKIRHAFKPLQNDWSFVSADYSQIELRLLAHMSEDPALVKAFKEKEDIHAFTAALVFDVPLKEVTEAMRYRAKAVNFGILYGQQAFGLSKVLGISYQEAASLIEKYFERYKRVKEFLEECKGFVRKHGYSLTLTGRKRPIPEIESKNPMIRAAAERLAVNTPLQGTQADLIKMAMIEIDAELQKEPLGFMLVQIHDELLFEAPDHSKEKLAHRVKWHMEKIYPLNVPLTVNISFGKNWGEC